MKIMNKLVTVLSLISLLFVAPLALSSELQLSSSKQQTQLIELYTSEGCSSCPPADQWLSQFVEHKELWRKFIPIAIHVDYWDSLGWPDRFASPKNTLRQYTHKQQDNIRQVYTPGFVVNGEEWRGWYSGRSLKSKNVKPGVLSIDINENRYTARFEPEGNTVSEQSLYVAILGFGLTTPVRAGENKGELLNHDFVMLALKKQEGKNNRWQGELPAIPEGIENEAKQLAIVAWVSHSPLIVPVQSVAGWYR